MVSVGFVFGVLSPCAIHKTQCVYRIWIYLLLAALAIKLCQHDFNFFCRLVKPKLNNIITNLISFAGVFLGWKRPKRVWSSFRERDVGEIAVAQGATDAIALSWAREESWIDIKAMRKWINALICTHKNHVKTLFCKQSKPFSLRLFVTLFKWAHFVGTHDICIFWCLTAKNALAKCSCTARCNVFAEHAHIQSKHTKYMAISRPIHFEYSG